MPKAGSAVVFCKRCKESGHAVVAVRGSDFCQDCGDLLAPPPMTLRADSNPAVAWLEPTSMAQALLTWGDVFSGLGWLGGVAGIVAGFMSGNASWFAVGVSSAVGGCIWRVLLHAAACALRELHRIAENTKPT